MTMTTGEDEEDEDEERKAVHRGYTTGRHSEGVEGGRTTALR